MKVFLSSVIGGFETFREAAADAITTLGHTVIRSEQFTATTTSPQVACLTGIRQSDAVVVVLGERYGDVQRSGLSATHEEFREARDTKPTIVFVRSGITAEPNQAAFITEAGDWATGSYAPRFESADDLKRGILRGLHELELATASGPVDQDEMLRRALAQLPDERGFGGEPSLVVAVVGGPRRSVLRPAELEDPNLGRDLTQAILFGPSALFDATQGTSAQVLGGKLVLQRPDGSMTIDGEGTVVVTRRLHRERTRELVLHAVVEEDVRDDAAQVLRFADTVFERIDPTHRLTHVVPVAGLLGVSYGGWRTRAEQAASPRSMTMNLDVTARPIATLSPPARPRQALRFEAAQLAHDITVLLRRAATR